MKKQVFTLLSLVFLLIQTAGAIQISNNVYINIDDAKDRGCIANPETAKSDCPNCEAGMPTWWVTEPYLNLWVGDMPGFYTTSTGQKLAFQFRWKQRDQRPNTPNVDEVLPSGWDHNWWGYIRLHSTQRSSDSLYACSNWVATLYAPGGGSSYIDSTNWADTATGAKFYPITGRKWDVCPNPGSLEDNLIVGVTGFRQVYADGSQDIYGKAAAAYRKDSTTNDTWDIVLTEKIDSYGNSTKVHWVCYYKNTPPFNYHWVPKYVVDSDNRTNTFSYDLSTYLLTNITTAYNQNITFDYNMEGRVNYITDVQGIRSGPFTYSSITGWLTDLKTPYKLTRFFYTDAGNMQNGADVGNMGGTNRINRAILVRYPGLPDPSEELFIYRNDSSTVGVGDTFNVYEIPAVSTPIGTLDSGLIASNTGNKIGFTSLRNSFHWNKQQYKKLSTTDMSAFNETDYAIASLKHWLVEVDTPNVSERLSVSKEASTPGQYVYMPTYYGQTTWYDYEGKPAGMPWAVGSGSGRVVAQVRGNGTTWYRWQRFTPLGNPYIDVSTWSDTGVPVTRTYTYEYNRALGSANFFSMAQLVSYSTGYWTNEFLSVISGPNYDYELTVTAPTTQTAQRYITNRYNGAIRVTTTLPVQTEMLLVNAVNDATTIYHNSKGQISGRVWPNNTSETNYFNTNGFLAQTVQYDKLRNPVSTNSVVFNQGLPVIVTNVNQVVTTYSYDKLQRLTSVGYPDGTTISNVYSLLDMTATKDRLNNWSYNGYDAFRHLTSSTDELGRITYYTYNNDLLDTVTDPTGATTSYTYDMNDRVITESSPDGFLTTYNRNRVGQVTNYTTSAGINITIFYNNQGQINRMRNASGTDIFRQVYNIKDCVITNITPTITEYNTYDLLGRLQARYLPNGGYITNLYNANGLYAKYDEASNVTRIGFDAMGHPAYITNANAEVIKYTYNKLDQVTSITDGNNRTIQIGYDSYGRQTSLTNALAVIQTNGYNAAGQIVSSWTPAKGTQSMEYDAVGNLLAVRYANLSILRSYDELDRLVACTNITSGTNLIVSFAYTNFGAFRSAIASEDGPWDNDTINYSYWNRKVSGRSIPNSWNEQFTYDVNGRLKTQVAPEGTYTYSYKDVSSLISSIVLPNSLLITNTYDNCSRLTGTSFKSGNSSLNYHGYDYTINHMVTNAYRTYNNMPMITSRYGYDPIGQVKSATGYEANGSKRFNENYGYSYDKSGNLAFLTNDASVVSFFTDGANQLTNLTRNASLTFAGTLDGPITQLKVNNFTAITNSDRTYSVTNLTLNNGSNTFTVTGLDMGNHTQRYSFVANLPATLSVQSDLNGNILKDGLRNFEYDDANRLARIIVSNQWRTDFIYDGLSRLQRRVEYVWAGTWQINSDVRYVNTATSVIQERDGNNVPTVTYTLGSHRLARTDSNGPLFYHVDGSGNVSALLNPQGQIKAKYIYDTFGNLISKSGPMANNNLYRFASREVHANSGLYNFGLRFYDPVTQRWLNRDPIGILGGLNTFQYGKNSPTRYTDSNGEFIVSAAFFLMDAGILVNHACNGKANWQDSAAVAVDLGCLFLDLFTGGTGGSIVEAAIQGGRGTVAAVRVGNAVAHAMAGKKLVGAADLVNCIYHNKNTGDPSSNQQLKPSETEAPQDTPPTTEPCPKHEIIKETPPSDAQNLTTAFRFNGKIYQGADHGKIWIQLRINSAGKHPLVTEKQVDDIANMVGLIGHTDGMSIEEGVLFMEKLAPGIERGFINQETGEFLNMGGVRRHFTSQVPNGFADWSSYYMSVYGTK